MGWTTGSEQESSTGECCRRDTEYCLLHCLPARQRIVELQEMWHACSGLFRPPIGCIGGWAVAGVSELACRSDMNVRCRGEPLSQEILDFKPNIILAADCVYFEPAFPLLLQTMKDLLALVPSATIYFCFKKRRRADMQFLKSAKKAFTAMEIEDEDRPVFSREGLFLYAFTRK